MTSDLAWTVWPSPIGPLLLAGTERGLVSVGFHAHPDRAARRVEELAGRLDAEPLAREAHSPGHPALAAATAQLSAYFDRQLRVFDLELDWSLCSPFHARVLRELYDSVPFGHTTGYQDLATRVGEPGAARAVGVAMGANPLPVVVPCHRVVESGGGLGGFGGGRDTKRELLALEGLLPEPLF
ncbi:methylated-DNA--[protein]-cysteine S-methyltransferase [Streptomyces sp. NPDC005438]|uniref:methylated-DNA--[protein]-cysteine S-methyltransferase n=1 Tax=Streptomyces sp. NPDC005438 TaxID=3156880 RepID=UPI0033B82AC3